MTTAFRRALADAVARVEREDMISRIWARDWTVFGGRPDEIADRLGWLDLPRSMQCHRAYLEELARDVVSDGFRHVVVLGMGGSSLAPEVFRQTFGAADGHPELLVLDSTVPGAVLAVRDRIDAAASLFIVSSKSGTTAEPLAFMEYFFAEVRASGADPGRHFVALTDPGTPLVTLARERGFRAVVENQSDIGGRYSALSLVGLVPAALIGMDVQTLLQRAGYMAEACGQAVPTHEHPGVALGAAMAAGALSGRDKLTLTLPDDIAAFGLWAEQLVAESLGKDGTGVVPVVGEPGVRPEDYGDDRLFVQLRLTGPAAGPEERRGDETLDALAEAGHPVITIELDDPYDLGAQFVLWEFATAVAGALLGVQPFDQPDVEEAKVRARNALSEFVDKGEPVDVSETGSLAGLLSDAMPGDYLAVMAFIEQTPELDEAFAQLRKAVTASRGIATTVGYGPRFLHSTGQLHKGGPDSALCLQVVGEGDDLEVPGAGYGFRVLADSQATGDLAALVASGRRVARVRVGEDPAAAIAALVGQVMDSAERG